MSTEHLMRMIAREYFQGLAVLTGLRSGPQGRLPARSDAPEGRESEDIARPDGRAEGRKPR
jgi:hypothetical protein